jgi:transcriptional regulator with XRE-family HTH domain
MKRIPVQFPKQTSEMAAFGERIRDARLRRRFTMATVCARAGITRPTLTKVEVGDASVAFGIYASVLRVLGLLEDLSMVAKEDKLGRMIQDESLPHRKRVPKVQARKVAKDVSGKK